MTDKPDKVAKAVRGKAVKPAKVDTITREEIVSMLAELETRLTTMVNEKLAAVKSVSVDTIDKPPLPPKTGKKYIGSKGNLRARIDSELLTRVEQLCHTHFRGNMSACLDAVLWNAFGKPHLSFETEGDEHDQTSF